MSKQHLLFFQILSLHHLLESTHDESLGCKVVELRTKETVLQALVDVTNLTIQKLYEERQESFFFFL